jgi:t-SNARE complex subunit (syntaxin)
MKDISDWINIFFIGMVVLFILNMFSPNINYPEQTRNKKLQREPQDDQSVEKDLKTIELDKKDLKIQELEKELQNYKERIEDFRSQTSTWETIVKKSLKSENDTEN